MGKPGGVAIVIGTEKKPEGGNLFGRSGSKKDDGEGSYEEDKGESSGEEADEESMSADELADTLGLDEEKRADFKDALKSYVSICVSRALAEHEEG